MSREERVAPAIRVWRMHPRAARIAPADVTLGEMAPKEGLRYCGPFTNANAAGFYVHSPIDIDITYRPREPDRWEWEWKGPEYEDDEVAVLARMAAACPVPDARQIRPRTKVFLAGLHTEPRHTVQIWTGCMFQTPPGWGLWIRTPINRNHTEPFVIQEGILETDWMTYDVSINVRFTLADVTAQLRTDGPPLAHLIPVPRQTWGRWELDQRTLDPDDEEARRAFAFWAEYDHAKFFAKGEKDSGVYHRMRRAAADTSKAK